MRPIRRLPHKAHFGKSRGAGSYAGPNVGKGSRLCENSNDRAPVYKFQSIFGPFPAITGSAERKSSLLMRRFQTISEFSHSLGRRAVGPASPRRPERPWPGAAFDPRLRHQRHGSSARCRRRRVRARRRRVWRNKPPVGRSVKGHFRSSRSPRTRGCLGA